MTRSGNSESSAPPLAAEPGGRCGIVHTSTPGPVQTLKPSKAEASSLGHPGHSCGLGGIAVAWTLQRVKVCHQR